MRSDKRQLQKYLERAEAKTAREIQWLVWESIVRNRPLLRLIQDVVQEAMAWKGDWSQGVAQPDRCPLHLPHRKLTQIQSVHSQ